MLPFVADAGDPVVDAAVRADDIITTPEPPAPLLPCEPPYEAPPPPPPVLMLPLLPFTPEEADPPPPPLPSPPSTYPH